MSVLARLRQPPWRTFVLLGAVLGVIALAYAVWSPGAKVRDGSHDRGTNGMWLQHGWLGHDEWFDRYGKDREKFRDPERLDDLSKLLSTQGITWVFPHLCPCNPDGSIAKVNIEPMPSGNADFLILLKELRLAIPGKIISVAAYPPPTRWHPFPDVHWDEWRIFRSEFRGP